jgi:8-oxo-dGTP pyrophosphatase MutT (NUDIX family)
MNCFLPFAATIVSQGRGDHPMKPGKLRALAIGIFRRDDQILVSEGYDPIKGETFYRPLGGSIDFGEHGHQTLARELREELGVEVTNLRYLGLSENIFTYAGKRGHEIVLIYEGDLADRSLYEHDQIVGHEDDGSLIRAAWKSLDFFRRGSAPLYPDGLLNLLPAQAGAREEHH